MSPGRRTFASGDPGETRPPLTEIGTSLADYVCMPIRFDGDRGPRRGTKSSNPASSSATPRHPLTTS